MNKLQSAMKNYEKKKVEKVLILDVYNLLFRTVNYAYKDSKVESLQKKLELAITDADKELLEAEISAEKKIQVGFFKYLFLTNIRQFVKKFNPTKLIMASDAGDYWRKDIYPEYKAQREGNRKKSKIDYAEFFEIYNSFIADLEKAIPNVYFLTVPRCEADDIIAVLCTERFKNSEFVNVSTDGDFYQLLQNKNYKQYNPTQKKMIKHLNPKQNLILKILTGDSGDNIPSVQAGCGPKTAAKWVTQGLDTALHTKTLKDNFQRNKELIDLSMVPKEYKDKILDAFDNYEKKPYKSAKAWNFFLKHRQKYLAENITNFSKLFQDLE